MPTERVDYASRIEALFGKAARALINEGVPASAVDLTAAHKPGRRPGDARSEFLANRAMGDWAEQALQKALNKQLADIRAVKFGNSDQIIAGDASFPAFFERYHCELAATGKRPDLLLVSNSSAAPCWGDDVSMLEPVALKPVTAAALAAVEVRSSKFLALQYEQVRASEARMKGRASRDCQSFTFKVEDLVLVHRWVSTQKVPHFYAQVFLDSCFVMSLAKMLKIIGECPCPEKWKVERNRNNQDKPTVHIPVRHGRLLGTFEEPPQFRAEVRTSRLCRVDAYVKPDGGTLRLDPAVLSEWFGKLQQGGT